MQRTACESKLRTLVIHAWNSEVTWQQIEKWTNNFDGSVFDTNEEQLHGLFALSRFMYFSKPLVREMLKSLYRDHFESPLKQRIRRNNQNTRNSHLIQQLYNKELLATRFVGVGNPSESGAHLLYYFRQINYLQKDLFVDFSGAFTPIVIDRNTREIGYRPTNSSVSRYVFFDDLVGSGSQVSSYLSANLKKIRDTSGNLDLRYMSLFATTAGLERLNTKSLFDGKAICLFELDDSYKAFSPTARYFASSPSWFQVAKFREMAEHYGSQLRPSCPLGYKEGQLLLGFAHNTPDNSLPIFWDEGHTVPWSPIFVRYDKKYTGNP